MLDYSWLYKKKKCIKNSDDHSGLVTHLESDILEC